MLEIYGSLLFTEGLSLRSVVTALSEGYVGLELVDSSIFNDQVTLLELFLEFP